MTCKNRQMIVVVMMFSFLIFSFANGKLAYGLVDSDGDGYFIDAAPYDCDDSDAAINPGASETCDDKDNDCDGLTDEGISGCWTKTGLSGGGTQINISVDPLNGDVVYVSSDMLVVYKSFDQGEHWRWSNRGVYYTQASGMGFDPVDADGDGRSDVVYQSSLKGVYRSVDGGETWDYVYDEGKQPGAASKCTLGECIYNHRQLHVGTDGTVYVPTITGKVVIGRNHGTVWEQLDIGASSEINSIVSTAPGIIVVATELDGIIKYDVNGGPLGAFAVNNVRDVSIDPSDSSNSTLYALSAPQRAAGTPQPPADFYKSVDGGLNWALVHHFSIFDTWERIQKYIGVNSSGTIILNNGVQLERSIDGGITWERIVNHQGQDQSGRQSWHEDNFIFLQQRNNGQGKKTSIAAAPDSDTWYVATQGGVGRSDDNGNNWYYKVDGLRLNGGSKCLEDPHNSDNIYCGMLDLQFIRSKDGGITWTNEPYEIHGGYFGDMADLVFDPLVYSDPSYPRIIYALTLQVRDAFILRGQEDDLGNWTWTQLYYGNWIIANDHFGHIRFDPLDHNTLYVGLYLLSNDGSAGILTSADKGVSWDWMSDGLPGATQYRFMDTASNGNLYVGTSNEGLYRFNYDLRIWDLIYSSQFLRKDSLSIDPGDPDTLWAGCSYHGGACKSIDGGRTWELMTGGIGNYYVSTTHTTNRGTVFIEFWNGAGNMYEEIAAIDGTPALDLIGTWYSVDGGSSWTKHTSEMNDLRVRNFSSSKDRTWATTYTTPIYIECTDSDGDGFAIEGGPCQEIDPDDTDNSIYPEAPEICDGKDNDGNGSIDDSTATEICDGIDNNCDGNVDEGSDNDGDEYDTVCGNDCDDSIPVVNPGAKEVCNNLDDNCDGITAVCNPLDTDWYGIGNEWPYRRKINTGSGLTLTALDDFPVLVRITNPADHLFTYARPDGNDIVFTDSSGNLLPYEIEYFNISEGRLFAWVQVQALHPQGTVLYMYYGNSTAADQENPEAVWDTHYLVVQHLNETSGQHYDSTGNNNNSIEVQVNQQGQIVEAKIGGADEFVTDDYITIPDSGVDTPLDFIGNRAATFSAWVYARSSGELGTGGILSKGGAAGLTKGYKVSFEDSKIGAYGNCGPDALGASRGGKWNGPCDGYTRLPLKKWHRLTFVHDPSSSPATRAVYINGVFVASNTGDTNVVDTTDALKIGEYVGDSWDGYIDEVRISDTARTPEWISASYKNQNDPDRYLVQSEEIYCTDNDGDGYSVDGGGCGPADCDDSEPSAYPGAAEICDGIDNNCDQTVDEGCVDLDIVRFGVPNSVKLGNEVKRIQLTVENPNGGGQDMRPAVLIGVQNGTEIYNQTRMVFDLTGTGRSRFGFPPFTPTEAGVINWTVEILDDDPDEDTVTASTNVQ